MIRDKVQPEKREFAKFLRRESTSAEDYLWECLRRRQLGVKFRRQTIIRGFIVDFYCPKVHLVIEVDGESHFGREDYDSNRDKVLAELGIETIRFTNANVISNRKQVVYKIVAAVERRLKLSIKPFHGPVPDEIKEAWLQKQKILATKLLKR